MQRHYLVPLFLLVTLAACQSSGAPKSRAASLNQEVQLAPTERAEYGPQKLTVEFVRVVDDSRCPKDVTCVWAGEVRVEVATRLGSAEAVKHEIKTGEITKVDAFQIGIVQVQPDKLSTRPIAPEEYRVTFKVEQSQQ